MGLLRASIIFIIGYFSISIMDKHLDKIKDITLVGDLFGDNIIKFIKDNSSMTLLIFLTLVEFIL